MFLCFSSDENSGCPPVGVSCPITEAQHQLPGRHADSGPSCGTWASLATQVAASWLAPAPPIL